MEVTDLRRKVGNPLALAVLVLLYERPMHPYEMAATLRAVSYTHLTLPTKA